jgi:hypothetical protein
MPGWRPIVRRVASYAIFRLTVRNQNVRIRWAHGQPWGAATSG